MELEQFKTKIEVIYQQLRGLEFQGSIYDRDSKAVCTGGPRDVVNVNSQNVLDIMTIIKEQIEVLSANYEPNDGKEKVWKGITLYPPRLWVTGLAKNIPYGVPTNFTVNNIEVVTGLNWQIPNYKAMVNITLV